MSAHNTEVVTVATEVNAPVQKAWECFTDPAHIVQWAFASDEWHAPKAENDLRPGGSFSTRMEAKDGSFGFDFGGVYDAVKPNEYIEYTLVDGRKVTITFSQTGDHTKVVESFEPESENPVDMQQNGWQAIMDNYKRYTESA